MKILCIVLRSITIFSALYGIQIISNALKKKGISSRYTKQTFVLIVTGKSDMQARTKSRKNAHANTYQSQCQQYDVKSLAYNVKIKKGTVAQWLTFKAS